VVVQRATSAYPRFRHDVADARLVIAGIDEQGASGGDDVAPGLIASRASLGFSAASVSHAPILTTFIVYVAVMPDEGARGYGSVRPVKVGWLIDYPANAATTDDTLDSLRLVFDEAAETRLVDRPIELVKREVLGLPNGDFKSVQQAYGQLVAEGCLVVFGPYVSDNVVPLRSHVERTAEVPIITLAGSEGALGEWCFALNNGSMAEEPVMLAAVLKADGRSRIAIAHETSLIGKEYLGYAERAYEGAGLQIVGSVAIPQVETDKVEAVASLRATNPDAVVHVGFGHGIWGFNDALSKADWDPPRYTTTAFELAHIDPMWMVQLAGWIGLDSYDERNQVGQAFLDRFEERYGRRPNYFMPPLCRDVATVITHALGNARPLTGAGVKEAIEGVKFVPAASGAPGTCMQFGKFIRQGWMGVDYLVARRVLPDSSAHVFHAAPSTGFAQGFGS
jgi:branched-chain amino acid transport system substrate-binding protein